MQKNESNSKTNSCSQHSSSCSSISSSSMSSIENTELLGKFLYFFKKNFGANFDNIGIEYQTLDDFKSLTDDNIENFFNNFESVIGDDEDKIFNNNDYDKLRNILNNKKKTNRKIPDMEDRCCARQWQGSKDKKHSTLLQCTKKKEDGSDYCSNHNKKKENCNICESGCKKSGGVCHEYKYQCFGTINQRIIDIGKDEGNPERGYHLICLLHKNIENGVEYDLEDEIKEQYEEVPNEFKEKPKNNKKSKGKRGRPKKVKEVAELVDTDSDNESVNDSEIKQKKSRGRPKTKKEISDSDNESNDNEYVEERNNSDDEYVEERNNSDDIDIINEVDSTLESLDNDNNEDDLTNIINNDDDDSLDTDKFMEYDGDEYEEIEYIDFTKIDELYSSKINVYLENNVKSDDFIVQYNELEEKKNITKKSIKKKYKYELPNNLGYVDPSTLKVCDMDKNNIIGKYVIED